MALFPDLGVSRFNIGRDRDAAEARPRMNNALGDMPAQRAPSVPRLYVIQAENAVSHNRPSAV